MLTASLFILLGYLVGSLAAAVIVCRMLHLADPRSEGSGNPGTTNVMRLHGTWPALLTLAGDTLKGLLPVLLAAAFGLPVHYLALIGLAAFIGHLYPLFFGLQGGKGVATMLGALFGIYWPLGLAFVAVWLLVAVLFRYSSLSALVAALLAPVYTAVLLPDMVVVLAVGTMSLLLIARHRSNIRNLLDGTEERFGAKEKC